MRVTDVVASTDHTAFATDARGNILAFNDAARRLLGYTEAEALRGRCYELIQGTDPFGNRFCHESCAVADMARRREPVRDFELHLRDAAGRSVPAMVSVLVIDDPGSSGRALVHLVTPLERSGERASRRLSGDGHRPAPPVGPRGDARRARHAAHLDLLTPRETEVLALLADGKSTAIIADELCISVGTVRNHVKNTLKKLDVHSRLEAIALARRRSPFGAGD